MSEPTEQAAPPPPAPAEEPAPPPPPRRRLDARVLGAAAAGVVAVLLLVTAPLWWQALPGGGQKDGAEPARPAPAAVAPEQAIAASRTQAGQAAAAVQQLAQRVAALEAKAQETKPTPDLAPLQQRIAALEARPAAPPAPDLAPIQQQLGALKKATGDLGENLAALQKAAAARPNADPKAAALALALLQIREAVDIGRPFGAEYRALVALARDHPEIAEAAAPLAGPAESGVASRAALTERLRDLAPQIATAKPPANPGWKGQIVARLRALVTIRRIDEGDGQDPAEAAVGTARRDLAGGDLAGAVAALDGLTGASQAAAQPWLQTAKQRLAAEDALRRTQTALTAALGTAAGSPQGG